MWSQKRLDCCYGWWWPGLLLDSQDESSGSQCAGTSEKGSVDSAGLLDGRWWLISDVSLECKDQWKAMNSFRLMLQLAVECTLAVSDCWFYRRDELFICGVRTCPILDGKLLFNYMLLCLKIVLAMLNR